MKNLRRLDLSTNPLPARPMKKWGKNVKKHTLYFGFFALLVTGLFFWFSSSTTSSPLDIINPASRIETDRGRVNVLLLGIAGGNHDGPNLTDSIIVASYNINDKSVDLISLPRDLWVDSQKAKVNTIYQTGLTKGGGLNFAEDKIGEILGIKIPYGVRVDFSAFVRAVDQVGGLDINVENTFDDWAYPIPGKEDQMCGKTEKEIDIGEAQAKGLNVEKGKHKALLNSDNSIATTSAKVDTPLSYNDEEVLRYFPCRYEHLHFEKGLTHMDGMLALKFVRSRHGTGPEGSDFARSRRQQLVLETFKDKVLEIGTLTDPSKIGGLLGAFGSSIDLDIPASRFVQLISMVKGIKKVSLHVIDGSGTSPALVKPDEGDYGGAWVLIPPHNDYTVLQNYVNRLLYPESTKAATIKR